MAKVRERALDHKCPNCGSKILFVPALGKWKCDNCNGEFDLEELKKHNNASSEENNDKKSEVDDTNYVEYHCKDCGAGIIADENTASTFCVYCGNTAILKSKLSGKFAPSKIIPFKKSKEEAIDFHILHQSGELSFFAENGDSELLKRILFADFAYFFAETLLQSLYLFFHHDSHL